LSHAQQSQLAHGTTGAQLLPATGDPARYLAPLAFDDRTVLSPHPEFAQRDFRMTTFDLDWKLPFARLRSSTSNFKDTRVGQADDLGTGSFFYGTLGYPEFRLGSSAWIGSTAFLTFDNAYSGTVHETRLTSLPGGAVDWIAELQVPSHAAGGLPGYWELQMRRRQQLLRVGLLRRIKQRLRFALLNHIAIFHHDHAV
jgi:hypothetical protein